MEKQKPKPDTKAHKTTLPKRKYNSRTIPTKPEVQGGKPKAKPAPPPDKEVHVAPVLPTVSRKTESSTIYYLIYLTVIIVVLIWAWSDTKSEARQLREELHEAKQAIVVLRRDFATLITDLEAGKVTFHDTEGHIIPPEAVTIVANGFVVKQDGDQIKLSYK